MCVCVCVFMKQMLSLMETQAAFFQQGHQSLTELEEYRKQLSNEVRSRTCQPTYRLCINLIFVYNEIEFFGGRCHFFI